MKALQSAPHPADASGLILAATFARGTSTLVAARTLAERGYGVHAKMLCRSLFEDALTATWIQATAPEDIEQRHDAHIYMVRKLTSMATDREPTREEIREALTPEERRLFGEHGGGSWTGRSSFQQMQDLSAAWAGLPEEEGRLRGLWQWLRTFQRMNSTLLHHSPMGLEAFYRWPEGEPLELRIADQSDESFDALAHGLVTYGFLLWASVERFAPDRKAELEERRRQLVRDVDAAHRQRRERA